MITKCPCGHEAESPDELALHFERCHRQRAWWTRERDAQNDEELAERRLRQHAQR
jgi:hypothetical protein